jgi:hypothetical protein
LQCLTFFKQEDGEPGHGEAAGGAGLDADPLPPGGHHPTGHPLQHVHHRSETSLADPGSGAFLTPGSGIRDR